MNIEEARNKFPMGSVVKYFPVMGESHHLVATVRSVPWSLGSGQIVLMISDKSGGVSVNHLEPHEAPTLRASDGRPDDPHNGQCPVDEVAKKYRGAA